MYKAIVVIHCYLQLVKRSLLLSHYYALSSTVAAMKCYKQRLNYGYNIVIRAIVRYKPYFNDGEKLIANDSETVVV